ncbi:MAG: FAD binding domain-containing protein [Bacillota bacterium]
MAAIYRPVNLEDALTIIDAECPLVLAGGTDWMIKRERHSLDTRPVLYVGRLPELRQIARQGDTLRIGAACTLTELLESSLVPEYLEKPLIEMASPAIRNVATIGGNICNASPAADTLPMLYATDAVVCLQSAAGVETLSVQDFILGPGQTRLGEKQLLTEIQIPLQYGWTCKYRKLGMRRANSLSKLSFYALANNVSGTLTDIRIAFGAIAPTVVRCRETELDILNAVRLGVADALGWIEERYNKLMHPIDDVRSSREYRRRVSLRLLTQYLTEEIRV